MKIIRRLLTTYRAGIVIGFTSFAFATIVIANPVLNNIAAGNVTVNQSPNVTIINQASPRAILNWNSFNINRGQLTHFNQPMGGVALNRISPLQGASQIYGALTATGKIILINPAGIYFGPSAYVNVGGLIATTAGLSDADFLRGNYNFVSAPGTDGSIINAGTIIAANHGLVALVGSNVRNDGMIQANLGHVVLAAGDAYTMSFAGNDLINFAITKPSNKPRVTNNGAVIANGGRIMVSAASARGTLDNVINMNGVLQAQSVRQENGEIIIGGDPNGGQVRVAANINASGRNKNQTGGNVIISGYDVAIESPTTIDVSGDVGGGSIIIGNQPLSHTTSIASGVKLTAEALSSGNGGLIETSGHYLNLGDLYVSTKAYGNGKTGYWLLDPTNIYIANSLANAQAAGMTGGDSSADTPTGSNPQTYAATGAPGDSLVTVSMIQNSLTNNNVIITTTNASDTAAGNITVVDPISWSVGSTLTLQADNNIFINNAITGSSGGVLELMAGNNITTGALGAIDVGTFILTSGNFTHVGTLPSFIARNSFEIAPGATFIRAASGNGTVATPYVISDIFGLQGMNSSLASSFALNGNVDATSTSTWNGGLGFIPIGSDATPFTGTFDGGQFRVTNLYMQDLVNSNKQFGLFGTVNTAGTIGNVILVNPYIRADVGLNNRSGALVGHLIAGTVQNTGVLGGALSGFGNGTDTLFDPTQNSYVGGIVGYNDGGTITRSASLETEISGGYVGGIAGVNNGTISESYSSAALRNQGFLLMTGGIAGLNDVSGVISDSYFLGALLGDGSLYSGIASWNRGVISRVYSVGSISNASDRRADLVSLNDATIDNSFYTGINNPVFTNNGVTTNLNEITMNGADFTSAGWDLSSTWGIVEGESYPYLRAFYATTPQVINAIFAGAQAQDHYNLVQNGNIVGGAYTLNSRLYIQRGNSLITGDQSIATGDAILLYQSTTGGELTSAVFRYNGDTVVAPIYEGFSVSVGTSITDTFNYTSSFLALAAGALDPAFVLYSVTGNNITIDTSSGFIPKLNFLGVYSIDGNITGGDINFFNDVNITTSNPILTTLNPTTNISFFPFSNNTLNGNGNGLTINGGGQTGVGTIINLASLTKTGTGIFFVRADNTSVGSIVNVNSGELSINTLGNSGGINPLGINPIITVNTGGILGINGFGMAQESLPINVTLNGGTLQGEIFQAPTVFAGNITLTPGTTNTIGSDTAGNDFVVNAPVNGASDLIIAGPGNVVFSGAIGGTTPLTSLVSNANTTVTSVSTSGAQTYNNPLTVNGTLATPGSLNFANTVTGVNLIANAGNTVTFGNAVNLTGSLDVTGTNGININGTSIATNGAQTYHNDIALGASPTFTSGAGTITFDGAVNGATRTVTLQNATVGSTGNVIFNGNVNLANIITFGSPAAYTLSLLGSSNTFANAVSFNSGVVLGNNAGDTFNFNGGLTSNAATTLGGILNTNNAGLVLSDLFINADTAINTGTGIFTVNNVTGASDFSVVGSGAKTINGIIQVNDLALSGGTTTLNGNAVTPVVIANGDQTYGDNLIINNDVRLLSTSDAIFNGTVNGTGNLVVNADGVIALNQTIGNATPLASLSLTAANGITINTTAITTSGSQFYNNDVTLTASPTLSASDIHFTGNLTGATQALNVLNSTASFNGDVTLGGLTTSGASSSLNFANQDSTNTFTNAVSFTNTLLSLQGIFNFNGGFSITGDVSGSGTINTNNNPFNVTGNLSQAGSGTIAVNSGTGAMTIGSIGGGGNYILTNSSTKTINGNINVNNLTLTGGGTTTLNGTSVLTSLGSQIFNDAIVLGADNTFTGSIINFANTLNGPHNVIVAGGTSSFGGVVGGTSPLTSLTVNGTATSVGANVTTTGAQIYNAPLTLTANAIFNGSSLTFGSVTGSAFNLTGASIGAKTFNGAINVAALNLSGGSTILNTPSITTTGAQSYDALTLTAGTALNASTLTFGTINGAFALNATSTGATTFNNVIGGSTPLASLIVSAPGGININTTAITTTGAQTFNNDVTLGASPTLRSGSGAITFNGNVNGAAQTLTLQDASSTGAVIFNGDINVASLITFAGPYSISLLGNSYTFLNPVTFNNTGDLALGNSATDIFNFDAGFTRTVGTTTLSGIFNTNNSAFNLGTVALGANTAINTGAGALTLGAVSGAFALNANSALSKTLNGAINVASLSLGGGGLTTLNTGSVITSGTQIYTDALNLTATTNLSGSAVNFGNTVNGAVALTTNGATTFSGAVGNATPLASVTVNGSSVSLNNVSTSGAQTYNAPITLNGNAVLSGSIIGLNGIANGNNNSLGIAASTINVLGGLNALSSMNITGSGSNNTLTLDTAGTQTYNFNGTNSGTIAVAGVSSPITFSNIQNTIGGSGADNFILNPGSSQTSFNGGGGNNSLTSNFAGTNWVLSGANAGNANGSAFANIQNLIAGAAGNTVTLAGGSITSYAGSGSDTIIGTNAPSIWNFSGANSGNMSNVGSFTGVSDITGGSGGNTFNFANGATLSGTLFGGNDTTNVLNTINFSGYTSPVTVNLSANKFIGNAVGIVNYQNINSLVANSANGNILNVTPAQLADTTLSSQYVGVIGDPLYFNGFIVPGLLFGSTTTTIPSGGTFLDVSQIIQSADPEIDNNLIIWNSDVDSNIREIILDIDNRVDSEFRHVIINPYCSSAPSLGI